MKMRLLLLFFVITDVIRSPAQITPQEEGLQFFEEGRFSEALPIFKKLNTLFPKDPKYKYYTGVCMVQTNSELTTAIDYLSFAAQSSVSRNVYFYLGKAYHYSYRFDDALDAYLKFQQFGERADKDLLQCDMHINMSRNGKRLVEKYLNLNVYRTDTVLSNDLFKYYNGSLKSGKFQRIKSPKALLSDGKDKDEWGFFPSLPEKNQYIFGSTSHGSRKNRDLYRIFKESDDEWSRPEKLGPIVNSPFDEDYAFFNVSESALYFASKGHNSMGGYDIFKTLYDPDLKKWSAPVNLGFPVNTPYDDFLFVPADDQRQFYFASNRETPGDRIIIYTVTFTDKYSAMNPALSNDITLKAHLTPSSALAKNTVNRFDNKIKEDIKKTERNAFPRELLNENEYNEILNLALQYQLKSDSLSRVSEGIRVRIQSSSDETEKNILKKDMYALQQQSKAMQLKTDELYEKARLYEEKYSSRTTQKSVSAQSINDMARNAFKDTNKVSATVRPRDKNIAKEDKKKALKPSEEIVYEFKVMVKSPYTSISQIPINQPMPDGIIYRIQMGAFSKAIEPEHFKGIMPIRAETVQNSATIKYFAGQFSRIIDAEKALNKVREYGFKDSYIVSFYNGKNIPLNRARELEKEK